MVGLHRASDATVPPSTVSTRKAGLETGWDYDVAFTPNAAASLYALGIIRAFVAIVILSRRLHVLPCRFLMLVPLGKLRRFSGPRLATPCWTYPQARPSGPTHSRCRFRQIGYGACRPPPLVSPRELTAGLGGPLLPRAAVGLSCIPSFRLRDLTGDRLWEGGGLDLFSCHHGSYRALSGVSLGPLWDFMPLFHRRHAGQGFSAGCRSETCMGAFAALLSQWS